jgi:hypothetical protein
MKEILRLLNFKVYCYQFSRCIKLYYLYSKSLQKNVNNSKYSQDDTRSLLRALNVTMNAYYIRLSRTLLILSGYQPKRTSGTSLGNH